jgi:hypothetical protein
MCPANVVLVGFAGSVAPVQYQRSQGAMMTKTLYA